MKKMRKLFKHRGSGKRLKLAEEVAFIQNRNSEVGWRPLPEDVPRLSQSYLDGLPEELKPLLERTTLDEFNGAFHDQDNSLVFGIYAALKGIEHEDRLYACHTIRMQQYVREEELRLELAMLDDEAVKLQTKMGGC